MAIINQVKPYKIPKMVLLEVFNEQKIFKADRHFLAINTKDSLPCGKIKLSTRKGSYHLPDYDGNILMISMIESYKKNQGIGKGMINFAKHFSKQNGCNGEIVLFADCSLTPKRVPHLFYRKQGFTTLNKIKDFKMDMFIKKNKDATWDDFSSMRMFYSPSMQKEKPLSQKIKEFFARI